MVNLNWLIAKIADIAKGKKKTSVLNADPSSNPYLDAKSWEVIQREWEECLVKEASRKRGKAKLFWLIVYSLRDLYYWTCRFDIRDPYWEVKYFIQRGFRGWSDRDAWCPHAYIAKATYEMLIKVRNCHYGVPNTVTVKYQNIDSYSCCDCTSGYTCDALDIADNEWCNILDNIIYTFKLAHDITNGMNDKEIMLYDEKGLSESMQKHWTMLTKEETEKFWKGFDLFKEYFFSLYD